MKLQEYLAKNNVEESVCEKMKHEFKAMTLVDIERYPEPIQKKCYRRVEELSISKLIDDFFYVAMNDEGEIKEMSWDYGCIPNYINVHRFGKKFILKKEGNKVIGCYYRVI